MLMARRLYFGWGKAHSLILLLSDREPTVFSMYLFCFGGLSSYDIANVAPRVKYHKGFVVFLTKGVYFLTSCN